MDATILEEGQAVVRDLGRDGSDRFHVALTAGERARIVVEQRGLDVAAVVSDPSGTAIAEFDDEVRQSGEELVDVVAAVSGEYSIVVAAVPSQIQGGAYSIRLAGRRAADEADRAAQAARTFRSRAARLEHAGRYGEARTLFEQALTAAAPLGGETPLAGFLSFALAGNALEMHDDARARPLYERAIRIFERAWGAEHPYAAMARSRLAVLLERAGDLPAADAGLREALPILERTLGATHPWYAQTLITQANVRADAGDIEGARTLDERVLGILERIHEDGTVRYGMVLNNLGDIYRRKGETARAKTLFLRTLALDERLEGPESFRVSTTLQNLGVVAREQFDYAAALEYDLRALSIRERLVGPDHPDLAPLLNNLAVLDRALGDDAAALRMHFRALGIWEKSVGPYHPGLLNTIGNIARTYASMGDLPHAIEFERRADALLERQLALNVAAGSERQKLTFARNVSERTDRTLSLHLDLAPGDGDAAALAALVLLQRKGRVQDAMADALTSARQRDGDPADRALVERLNETNARLAQLALASDGGTRSDERRQTLAALEATREQLETALSERSGAFRANTRPVTVAAIQAAIPADAALVEFAVYRPFNPAAERNADAYGAPRYAAYVLRHSGAPVGVDLGDAAEIAHAVAAFRDALRVPAGRAASIRGRALDERIMRPVRPAVGDASRLLVSPDGDLNLVAFDALVDERGRFLIDRYAVTYVTSGRDLLRMQVPRGDAHAPVIVADPFFGDAARRRAHVAAVDDRRALPDERELASAYFAPLAATETEARAIKALFPDAALLIGRRATKAGVQAVRAPEILHIASHGFFLDDDGAGRGVNPLLRSGLAFAGANLAPSSRGDAILTALEASGLDLWGTRLVTLSACDTGVGPIRNGEGVYGLRRAFVLAGAETLVMSLWPVSDAIARDTMVAYYSGLRAGLGRADALRAAKRAMRTRPHRGHPYFWAAFIQSGEWAALDGRRPDAPQAR